MKRKENLQRPSGNLGLNEIKAILAREQIERLVLGGDFRLIETVGVSSPSPDQGQIVPFPQDDARRRLLAGVKAYLRSKTILAVHAAELLPELGPGQGFLAAGAALIPERHIEQVLRLSLPKARSAAFGSRHSLVFDDKNLVWEELHSTDEMLERLAGGEQKAYPRALVRIIAQNDRATIDAPVISEKTIELAAKAKVDVVLVDSESCVVYTRGKVKHAAEAYGVAVYAASIRSLETGPSDVAPE